MRSTRRSPHNLHQRAADNEDALPRTGKRSLAQKQQAAQAAEAAEAAEAANLPSPLYGFGNRTLDPARPFPLRLQTGMASNCTERFTTMSLNTLSSSGLANSSCGSPTPSSGFFERLGSTFSDMPSHPTRSRPAAPSSPATESAVINSSMFDAQIEDGAEWSIEKIMAHLRIGRQDIRERHSRLTGYLIESTKPVDRRVHTGPDLFANIRSPPVAEKKGVTMKVRFKQASRGKRDPRDQRVAHYMPVCTKTNVDRVPPYKFHHVEIKKNILTPNTMLTFVPHLRDLDRSEETKYNLWLKGLEEIDLKSGFKPMSREEKLELTIQGERAATVSLYLDTWLEKMAMPGCTKAALIRYMAARESDDAITPRQKSDILHSQGVQNITAPEADKAAEMFTEAFRRVFQDDLPDAQQVDLGKVLMLDESVDNIMDSKPIVKDASSLDIMDPHHIEDEDELAETNLATYNILGCLICYSHSCDHGEYDNKNMKRTFSMGSCSRLSDILKARRKGQAQDTVTDKICRRQCYRRGADHVRMHLHPRPWLEDERTVLRSLYTTTRYSSFRGDPICLAAEFLDRSCDEVYAEFTLMGVTLPPPEPCEVPRVKNLTWYDRRRKVLMGDWQDHTITHAHQRRENLEPCSHDGVCVQRTCSCVDAGVLCDKFCRCTVEECAYKFTGCACHSQGQACQQNRKDRPCICVQLNRECDPELCDSCGVLERANPLNADDDDLHATGCQNCDLQRSTSKPLLLGQSQLEGCGYGLFTAEPIAQDDFVIEYVGELITHDEGVRREARRGDVFDEESNVSYVFTLLEDEGIWVDAAIYGNLSRYINHASEHDTRGCNVTPRILYVNGEYRIKFTAMRDIQAGEELFFNYGENFPNLTKNLLDDKAARKPESKATKGARLARSQVHRPVPLKGVKVDTKRKGRGRPRIKREAPPVIILDTDEESDTLSQARARKRKRSVNDDSADDEDDEDGDGDGDGDEDGEDDDDDAGDDDDNDIDTGEESRHAPAMQRRTATRKDGIAKREFEEPGSALRLQHRSRRKYGQLQRSGRRSELSNKARGKRGGARPGSGRPRKHPRLIPSKPAFDHYEFPDDSPEGSPKLAAVAAVPSSSGSRGSSWRSITTPEQKRVPRRSDRIQVPQLEDKYIKKEGREVHKMVMPKTRRARRDVREKADGVGDKNVKVEKRGERAARIRRLPAKFRDDDIC
ncbi:related to polycomb group protein MEDEA [Claviceps purpurea 20.1]|uniref:Related to polycomb group protein MEDEA n=1 Tax=Claviceps purpurea (strain 20.1) TaxID=1111077 RepID=M1WIU0_CLAP2|nr:hypothetical protein E4U50_005143 [Claviceps purpurea]KAG6288590.1 hypothetical protein E4U46_003158 [Claviceps purpurea]CCE35135.1 related to polycomb group protein MEDEA [Claviceps purpurea 20.1]